MSNGTAGAKIRCNCRGQDKGFYNELCDVFASTADEYDCRDIIDDAVKELANQIKNQMCDEELNI